MPAPPDALIPSYSLYGEASDFPDVLHCEPIAARAMLHGWNIGAHRHARLHQFLLVHEGGGTAWLEGSRIAMAAMTFLNLPAGHVHAFAFVPGTQGWVITVPVDMLERILAAVPLLRNALSAAQAGKAGQDMAAAFAQIALEYGRNGPGRALMLSAGAALLAGHVARSLAGREAPEPRAAAVRLFARFESLVEEGFREHWPIPRYAELLGVSTTHLGRTTRRLSGMSAARFVEARLMREARRLLAYTTLDIQQVAFATGFEDPAYFSRAFSRNAGLSPARYRARFAGAQPNRTRPGSDE